MKQLTVQIKKCADCGSEKSKSSWYIFDGKYLCHRCGNKKTQPKRDSKRISFMNTRPYVTFSLRKGKCVVCKKKGATDMHHDIYIPCMPWAGTRELCDSCHSKIPK